MRTNSVLTVVAVLLCSVVASAYQDLESELNSIDKKATQIRELLSDSSSYRSFEIKELRDLECGMYGKTKGEISLNERGTKVFTDSNGIQFTSIKDYYYPSAISVYSLPLIESPEKKMIAAYVQVGNIFSFKNCALSMAKVGYRYVGELACEAPKGQDKIVEASVHSDQLQADSYIECAGPSKMI